MNYIIVILIFICFIYFFISYFKIKKYQDFDNSDDEIKLNVDNINLDRAFFYIQDLKKYNSLTFNDIIKNLNSFYKLCDYIKSDYNLFSRYYNDLLIYQNYIYILIESFYLNIPQNKYVKHNIYLFSQEIQKILNNEINNLKTKYKNQIINNSADDINIFTTILTDYKPRPYNMI